MKAKTPYVKLLHLLLFSLFINNANSVYSQILLQSSFEGSNPFAGFTNNQSCCSYSVTASTAHAHDGTQSFRAEVRQGDPAVSSGWRAELVPSSVSDQGDMWYGFSVYFETPVSGGNWTGSYGGHFIQWHPNNGTGSAELSIWGSDGLWDVCVNPTGGAGVTHQTQTASGGALQRITANVWHDVVFHVIWGSGGKVEVWIDGTLYFTKSNLNWASGAYLKFGMNRWGNCNGGAPCDTWVIYYDNLKIGRNVTYNDVAPSSSGNPPTNQSPTANAGNNITLTLPTNSTTLTGSGTDPDGTIASYAWSRVSGPTTFTLGSPNAATTTLSNLVAGTYVFRLTVTDNSGATATDDVTVTVNAAANQAPTANAGADKTLTLPANSTTLTGSGTDPDGTIASYAWTRVSGPTTFTLGSANAATTSLSNLVAGTYVFRLTVTDNSGATATDNVTVTVNAAPPANQPPAANAGSDITLTLPASSTTLTGSGTDPDGTIASYAWSRVSGPTTFTLGSANAASTSLSNLVQGVYVFRLTVTDNSGATATDNVTVTVNAATTPPANQPPTARTDNDIVLTLPANSTQLHGNASTDPDGVIVSYVWSLLSGPSHATITNGTSSIATISDLTTGIYTFELKVTDDDGASSTKAMKVTVQNQSGGPKPTLILYPNPSSGAMNMKYTANVNGKFRITIYDANRRLIRDEVIDKTQVSLTKAIDISGYESGVYFIQIMLVSDNKQKSVSRVAKM